MFFHVILTQKRFKIIDIWNLKGTEKYDKSFQKKRCMVNSTWVLILYVKSVLKKKKPKNTAICSNLLFYCRFFALNFTQASLKPRYFSEWILQNHTVKTTSQTYFRLRRSCRHFRLTSFSQLFTIILHRKVSDKGTSSCRLARQLGQRFLGGFVRYKVALNVVSP